MGSAPQQAALWGAEAQDWAELQEPHHRPLWDSMLTALGVEAGSRMLDAGCGGGGASMLAAARGAQVAGIDAADPLIEIARARIPGGEFTVGDLEALPYGAASFDCRTLASATPA